MINIITGDIDSGKTTRMYEFYQQARFGDGFVTKKIYLNNINIGQRIIRLSNGEDRVFSLKKNFIPYSWNEKYRYYDYSFSTEGINFAERIIYDTVFNKHEPIFIDEIGPLEIFNKQGLFNSLNEVIDYEMELFVVVRDECLKPFLERFDIKHYSILM